jgi:hypothetical protein
MNWRSNSYAIKYETNPLKPIIKTTQPFPNPKKERVYNTYLLNRNICFIGSDLETIINKCKTLSLECGVDGVDKDTSLGVGL